MWIVEAEKDMHGASRVVVVHLDTIVHAAHLIGIYGDRFYPKIMPEQSLDFFHTFYVNKLPTMVLQQLHRWFNFGLPNLTHSP